MNIKINSTLIEILIRSMNAVEVKGNMGAFGLQGMAGYTECRSVLMVTLYFVLFDCFLLIVFCKA